MPNSNLIVWQQYPRVLTFAPFLSVMQSMCYLRIRVHSYLYTVQLFYLASISQSYYHQFSYRLSDDVSHLGQRVIYIKVTQVAESKFLALITPY